MVSISAIKNCSGKAGTFIRKNTAKKLDLSGLRLAPLKQDVCEFTREDIIKILDQNPSLCSNSVSSKIEELEQFVQRSNGKYCPKSAEIVIDLTKGNNWIGSYGASSIIEKLNVAKTDRDALNGLKELFLKNKKESLHPWNAMKFWSSALEKDGSFTQKSLEEVKELLKKYPITFKNQNDFFAAASLRHFKGFKSIQELSITQKNELLNHFYSNGFCENVYKELEILPKTKEEYKKLISELIEQTSVKVKPLAQAESAQAVSTLEKISKLEDKQASEFISKLYPELGKPEAETVELLKKLMADGRFAELPQNDKLTLQLAAILKDSSKLHNIKDAQQSAYNAFYLAEKVGLPHENRLKLYAILKNQNLLKEADKGLTTMSLVERSACELRHENSLKMFEMLNDARGIQTGSKELLMSKLSSKYGCLDWNAKYNITQTKLPKASQFVVNGDSVQKVKKDGVENIVVYFDRKTPIQYKDENGIVKELIPADVYNYCHATSDLQGIELASRPNSNYAISSSFMNPTVGTHHMFDTEGVIIRVPKGNTYYEKQVADSDGTGFGKLGDARRLKRYHDGYSTSKICAKYEGQELAQLRSTNPQGAEELKSELNFMLSNTRYGENISFHPEPMGVFFEGPYKGYSPMYANIGKKFEQKRILGQMSVLEKAKYYYCKMTGKKYELDLYKFKNMPLEHRTYARDNDFAVFHLGR